MGDAFDKLSCSSMWLNDAVPVDVDGRCHDFWLDTVCLVTRLTSSFTIVRALVLFAIAVRNSIFALLCMSQRFCGPTVCRSS